MSSQSRVWIATLGAGVTIAFQVLGKAIRDTLFLTTFAVEGLPWMVSGAAIAAIASAFLMSRVMAEMGPKRATVSLYLASAALLVFEWVGFLVSPAATSIVTYIHLSAIAALLVSGFWSILNECFDPNSAKKSMNCIAVGATAGGLVGGLMAERLAAWASPTMGLLLLSMGHVLAAALCSTLRPIHTVKKTESTSSREASLLIGRDPYLRNLALVMVLATAAANILDFLFKAEAASRLDPAALMTCFGLFYTGVGVLTFVLQVAVGPRLLQNLGVARSTLPLPAAVLVGAGGMMAVPGLAAAIVARSTEAVVRSSFFRAGYELFFLPLNPDVRRKTKTLIDVGADRLGDIIGGISIIVTLFFVTQKESTAPLSLLAIVLAVAVAGLLESLRRGYIRTLESSLAQQAGDVSSLIGEGESLLFQTMAGFNPQGLISRPIVHDPKPDSVSSKPRAQRDPVRELSQEFLDPVILAELKALAADNPQPLIGVLLDSQSLFVARRRIPRILVGSTNENVQPALVSGLSDRRFEVRFHCGSALYLRQEREQITPVDPSSIYDVVEREVRVDERLWRTRNLLESIDDGDGNLVDQVLSARVDRSLQHVFHLLALLHPTTPLRIAFRGLHTDDPMLRGTALEYLESILPPRIRDNLWPLLGDSKPGATDRTAEQVLESLLQSHASIELQLNRRS